MMGFGEFQIVVSAKIWLLSEVDKKVSDPKLQVLLREEVWANTDAGIRRSMRASRPVLSGFTSKIYHDMCFKTELSSLGNDFFKKLATSASEGLFAARLQEEETKNKM